jgi:hypothetical protein
MSSLLVIPESIERSVKGIEVEPNVRLPYAELGGKKWLQHGLFIRINLLPLERD